MRRKELRARKEPSMKKQENIVGPKKNSMYSVGPGWWMEPRRIDRVVYTQSGHVALADSEYARASAAVCEDGRYTVDHWRAWCCPTSYSVERLMQAGGAGPEWMRTGLRSRK